MGNRGGDYEIGQASNLSYCRTRKRDFVDEEYIYLGSRYRDGCLLEIRLQVLRDPPQVEPQSGKLRVQTWMVAICVLLLERRLGRPDRIEIEASLSHTVFNLGLLEESDLMSSIFQVLRQQDEGIQMSRTGERHHAEVPDNSIS